MAGGGPNGGGGSDGRRGEGLAVVGGPSAGAWIPVSGHGNDGAR